MAEEKQFDELSFDFLNDEEKKVLLNILDSLSQSREDATVWKQVRKIKPFAEWIEDPYYCGYVGQGLYPHWKRVLTDVFDNSTSENRCNELIVTGGLGTGKSTTACVAAMYKLYTLSCYENIPSVFGLIPGSIIALFYFSVSRTQAELTGYGVLKNYVDSTPYFNDLWTRNKRLNSMMSFPESVLVVAGSDSSHAIGMNVILAILDEANFRQSNSQKVDGGVNNEKVTSFYMSLIQRGKSRFLRNGINESMMILISSNTTDSSFTDQRIAQAKTDPHVRIINARLWDVKPKGTYSDKGFWVFVGNSTYDAQIVENLEQLNQLAESLFCGPYYGDYEYIIANEVSPALKELLVWIPNDFRRQFDDDIYQSLQDVGGVSVCPSGRLFNNRQAYNKAVTEYNLVPVFTRDAFQLSTGDKLRVDAYINPCWKPSNRHAVRHWHYDQSTSNDRTGFASTYIEKWEKDPITGLIKPYFITETIGCVIPPKAPNSLSIRKCADILFIMRDKFNLPMGKITYDQFQSSMAIQELQANGFDADNQSVDRNADQYLYWVEAILDGRWHAPNNKVLEAELFNLVLDRTRPGGKVDHVGKTDNSNIYSGTSKDVCDAVAGSVYNAYTYGQADQENNAVSDMDVPLFSDLYGSDFEMGVFDRVKILDNDTEARLYSELEPSDVFTMPW